MCVYCVCMGVCACDIIVTGRTDSSDTKKGTPVETSTAITGT